MQSGKAVGVLRTHADAPRVLIANSNLVPHWATWEKFWELEKAGLMMYGQMTAGSWIYIGTQGILQGTYETFASAARVHYGAGADLRGRLVVSGGLGGMGGAQPLAVTMSGGVFLGVDVDPTRIQRRLETRYLDEQARDLDDALDALRARARRKGARSPSGSTATARASCPSWSARRRARPRDRSDLGARSACAATCRRASSWRRPSCCASAIRRSTSSWRAARWPSTCAR